MPGLDRTGPLGQGSGTGRGMGLCGPGVPANADTGSAYGLGRGGMPRGGGRGFGRGRGRGGGIWGRNWWGATTTTAAGPDPDEAMLRNEIRQLIEQVAALQAQVVESARTRTEGGDPA